MTALTCIASNHPLPEVKNPHYKTLSVNEALSMGIDVPDFCWSRTPIGMTLM